MGPILFSVCIPPLLLNPFGCLVDLHLHIGIMSVPGLNGGYRVSHAAGTVFKWHLIWSKGTKDGNSYRAPTLPWLRSIDGLNMHDASYEFVMVGGTTTAQILLGSANNIGKYMLSSSLIQFWHTCEGGQSFLIKLWPTAEFWSLHRWFLGMHCVCQSQVIIIYMKYISYPLTQYILSLYPS